jgi:hypothetical protein
MRFSMQRPVYSLLMNGGLEARTATTLVVWFVSKGLTNESSLVNFVSLKPLAILLLW